MHLFFLNHPGPLPCRGHAAAAQAEVGQAGCACGRMAPARRGQDAGAAFQSAFRRR